VTAVVVDLDGVRQAMLRGNGAPIHTFDKALYKAYSAASLTLARKEGSTKAVADRMAKSRRPPRQRRRCPTSPTRWAASLSWRAARPSGAIGVSGAPGGQFDEECARAAIAKIQDGMK
jgi:uncharacterized protein GlcG (DUF336 family)